MSWKALICVNFTFAKSAQNNNWKPMAKWIPFRPQRLDDSLWGGQGEKCSSLWHKDAKVDVKTTCLPLIFTHLFKLMRLYLGKGNEIHPQTVHSFILISGKLLLIKFFCFSLFHGWCSFVNIPVFFGDIKNLELLHTDIQCFCPTPIIIFLPLSPDPKAEICNSVPT